MAKDKKLHIYELSEEQTQEISQQIMKEEHELWEKHCGGKDILSSFLKAHLLIEKQLDEVLTLCLPKPKKLLDKSTFAQKILLIEALNVLPNKDFYKKLRAINKLRNYYVHHLDEKFDQKDSESIASDLGINTKELNSKDILVVSNWVFGFLSGIKTVMDLFPFISNSMRNWESMEKDKCFLLCAPIIKGVYPEVNKIMQNLKIKERF